LRAKFEKRIGSPGNIRTYDPQYSCCNRQVAGFRFPQSSRQGVVEFITCVLGQGVSG
jgi:hypothetical protein